MSQGSTRTGGVLERMVLPALEHGGYTYETQVHVGQRLGMGKHMLDAVVAKGDDTFLVSVKWQQIRGTAEQKVPYEMICLAEVLETGLYKKAYLVLGGEGWTLRDFYTSGALRKYIPLADKIEVVTLEGFVGRANQGKL